MIITSIHYTFASEDADRAESLFRQLRDASVREPGVIQFTIGRSTDETGVFALCEVYWDKYAADAHRRSEHFERLVVNGIRPLALGRTAINAKSIKEVSMNSRRWKYVRRDQP